MNNITPSPPPLPPQIPPTLSGLTALGDHPADREPIPNFVAAIEAILRHPRRVMYQLRQPDSGQLILTMLLVAIVCSLIYGVVVGTFSMETLLWAAPLKICCGMLISGVICAPSLYIFTCLSGSQARLAEMCGLFHGRLMPLICWVISVSFGPRFLLAGFSHPQARSSAGLNTWIIVFVLVVLQMTTALRPIVGTADTFLPEKKQFFIGHWAESLSQTEK